jgi:hypothetical protein
MGKLKAAITNVAGNVNPHMLPKAAAKKVHYRLRRLQTVTEPGDMQGAHWAALECSPRISAQLSALYQDEDRVSIDDRGAETGHWDVEAIRETQIYRHIMAHLPAALPKTRWCLVELHKNAKGTWYVRLGAF